MRILDLAQTRGLFSPAEAYRAIEDAYRGYGVHGRVLSEPSSTLLRSPAAGQLTFRFKGAVLPDAGVAGVRLQSGGRSFLYVADARTSEPIGLVDEKWLYRHRTAMTAAVAAKFLARPGAKVVGLVGTGPIGDEMFGALCHALDVAEFRVAARRPESAAAYAARHGAGGRLKPRAVASPEEAIKGADVAVTITTAKEAFVKPGWLAPGALLLSMGGCPEVEFGVLAECGRVIVDDLDFALMQGDFASWVAAGRITREQVTKRVDANIGEVVAGKKPGRTDPGERILAVIQGMAVCDLALAKLALDKAAALGRGAVVAP